MPPIEAPTVRGFVSLLLEGLEGATVEDVLQVPNDLVERCGLTEILGMLRVRGLSRRAPAGQGRGDPRGDRHGRTVPRSAE